MCAHFLSHLLLLYIGRVHEAISGCTVLWEVHPASAQNKSLISGTVYIMFFVCGTKPHRERCVYMQCSKLRLYTVHTPGA